MLDTLQDTAGLDDASRKKRKQFCSSGVHVSDRQHCTSFRNMQLRVLMDPDTKLMLIIEIFRETGYYLLLHPAKLEPEINVDRKYDLDKNSYSKLFRFDGNQTGSHMSLLPFVSKFLSPKGPEVSRNTHMCINKAPQMVSGETVQRSFSKPIVILTVTFLNARSTSSWDRIKLVFRLTLPFCYSVLKVFENQLKKV